MDRTLFWDMNQDRTFDHERGFHDVLLGLSYALQDLLGTTYTVLAGFTATQTSPPSLSINLAAGRILQLASVDAVADGAIPQDVRQILQQGIAPAQAVQFTTTDLIAGQSRWALVQAQFSQTDSVRDADPNAGLLYFYNAVNPGQPFQGPNNNQQVVSTVRQGLCAIEVIYGPIATTGSEVPPQPSGGWVPMYLVDITFGQSTITTAQVIKTGPSVGTGVPPNYTTAPFLAGLLAQHHLGTPGQAPQIDLSKEVTGRLLATNLPTAGYATAANIQVFQTSGTFTVPAGVTKVWAVVIGGGGGGGGTTATTSGQISIAGGGASGSVGYNFLAVTPGTPMAVTIGSGGAGGTAGGGNGGTGGTSTFSTISAPGGSGAAGVPTAVPPVVQFGGSNTPVSSGGVYPVGGNPGGHAFCGNNTGNFVSGSGGQSPLGAGAVSGVQNAAGVSVPNGLGAGGSGGASGASASGFAGGAGSNGTVIIYY